MTDTSNSLSNCHQAPTRLVGGRGDFRDSDYPVTMHYECTECNEPCDLWTPNTSMSVDDKAFIGFLELYDVIDGWYHEQTRHHLADVDPDVKDNMFEPLMSLIEQYALNKQVEVINRFEQSINQHTTPEGSDLLTRSYVRNTIDFERHRITELEKQLKTEGDE